MCQFFPPPITSKAWQRFILPTQDCRPDVHISTPASFSNSLGKGAKLWTEAAEMPVEIQFSWFCPEGGNMAQVQVQQLRGVSVSKLRSQALFYSWHQLEPLLHTLMVRTIIWGREDTKSASKFYPLVLINNRIWNPWISIGAKVSCICNPAANSDHRGIWKLTDVILLLSIWLINFTILALLRKTRYIACDFAWVVTCEQNDTIASRGSHNMRWLPHRAPASSWCGPCGLDHLNNIADFFFSKVWFLMHWYHESHWSLSVPQSCKTSLTFGLHTATEMVLFITWWNSAENFKKY